MIRILDILMLVLAASLTLWADLSSVEIAMPLAVLAGATLGGVD